MNASYADFNPAMYDKPSRNKIAKQILTLLKVHLNTKNLEHKKALDLGCSSGIMTAYWSKHFKNIVGIDPDKEAIKFARKNFASKNMTFKIGYAERTGLAANTLDIIICNQVYYWIPDQEDLVNEIYHILKPGGICFFGARNKYTLWDAQYYLPLLGILPKRIADKYVKLAGRADTYECRYLSYWELKKYYSRKFKIHDYTPKVIKTPSKYGYVNLAKFEGIAKHLPLGVWEAVTPVLPNFIWILEKPLK